IECESVNIYASGSGLTILVEQRKGAPFYTRFSTLMARLGDTGIMDDSREVVLGLHHLQGGFYLLFLGFSAALLSLVGEVVAGCLFLS
ncbi:hypothetical protein Hamer_G030373, partial [Homarus americanus]